LIDNGVRKATGERGRKDRGCDGTTRYKEGEGRRSETGIRG